MDLIRLFMICEPLPMGPSSLPLDPSVPQGGSAATATAAALAEAVATGGCGSVSQVSDAVTVPKRIRRYRYKPSGILLRLGSIYFVFYQ